MSLEHMTIADGLEFMEKNDRYGGQSSTTMDECKKVAFANTQLPAKVSARLVILAQTTTGHLVRVPLSAPDIHSIVRHALDGKS